MTALTWQLVGPLIPVWVWKSHMKRAAGFTDGRIQWEPMPDTGWQDFDAAQGARTLLLVHGTGLRTEDGFRGLTATDYQRLRELYGDRILAFQHKAFAHRIRRNAIDLVTSLARGQVALDLDVVALSRGGLVVRFLTEGWAKDLPGIDRIRIRKLIFIGTPNGGTPSARRALLGLDGSAMKAWRTDVRRLTLVNVTDRDVEVLEDPHSLAGFDPDSLTMPSWPLLLGSQDLLPVSEILQVLNGFRGPAPSNCWATRYFGVASVFTFDHGAPDDQLLPDMKRSQVTEHALPGVPNDLVVPTRSVIAPLQGPNASGLFPISGDDLLVLGPRSNVTHTSMMLVDAVRKRILSWLATP